MTCKDCIHYDVCLLGACVNGATGTCLNFKDKSRILELPCKVGDFVEWDKGFGVNVLYRVNGFRYNPDDLGLRYILKDSSPIVGISHITKIIPEEEALRKAVEK